MAAPATQIETAHASNRRVCRLCYTGALGDERHMLLVYADDVVLLSWSASGLQVLLDSMDHFCVGLAWSSAPPKQRLLFSMARELQALGGLAPRFFHSLLASNALA